MYTHQYLEKARAVVNLARKNGLNTFMLEELLLCDLGAVRDGRGNITPAQLTALNTHRAEFSEARSVLHRERLRERRLSWVPLHDGLRA